MALGDGVRKFLSGNLDNRVADMEGKTDAQVSKVRSNGGDGDVSMKVKRVGMGIEPLIKKSNDFTKKVGLQVKTAGKKK